VNRVCKDCGNELELNKNNFYFRNKRDGSLYFSPRCRKCENERLYASRKKSVIERKSQDDDEILEPKLVMNKVTCRNRCTHRDATFYVSLPKGEKPKNIYLCARCREIGVMYESLEARDLRSAKVYIYDSSETCTILKGEALEQAKKECTHISNIPDRRYL